jgi:hypothetical protein
MIETSAHIEELVARELSTITQPELVALIKSLRVSPRKEDRPWDYGAPGQTYPCWIVLDHSASNTAVAYCAEGFGPRCPWGLLFIKDHPSIGMDSSWFVSLEDAVRNCMAWEGEDPPGYEVQ